MKFAIAFLMILFLVQCKSQTQREPLKLFLPKDSELASDKLYDPKTTFTLLLAGSNTIWYYTGPMNKGDWR